MSTSTPDRGVITDTVIAVLQSVSILVGDVKAPEGGGWQDQPGKENAYFIPYVVLTPNVTQAPTGGVMDPGTEWRLGYTLTTYGVNRRQVEDLADDARRALGLVAKVEMTMKDGTTVWKWQQTTTSSLGGVGYTDQIKPTAYSQSDSVLVWISKRL